jgi:hypothetical protein
VTAFDDGGHPGPGRDGPGPAPLLIARTFVRRALRRELSGLGDAVVYAQRAALRARRGANQRLVVAVHRLSSQADGWVERGSLGRGSSVYHAIRRRESETIPGVDAMVCISELARDILWTWLPGAKEVPSVVVTGPSLRGSRPSCGRKTGRAPDVPPRP